MPIRCQDALDDHAKGRKLLDQLGGAQAIGPILVGMARPVHILQRGSDVNDIVNMAIIAAVDAQEHGPMPPPAA